MNKVRAVNCLTEKLNTIHGTQLTCDQVENWVGSASSTSQVNSWMAEVGTTEGVTPDDILDLWE